MTAATTWILDENLSSKRILERLRASGLNVRTVPDEFGRGCPDIEWLAAAGKRGYAVITKDMAMRRTPIELAVLRDAGVRCFAISHGNLRAEEIAELVISSMPQMVGILRSKRGRRSVFAKVHASGTVRVVAVWG